MEMGAWYGLGYPPYASDETQVSQTHAATFQSFVDAWTQTQSEAIRPES